MVSDRLPTHGRGDAHHAAKPVLQPVFSFAHPRTAWPSETILIRASTNTYAAFPVILRGIRRKPKNLARQQPQAVTPHSGHAWLHTTNSRSGSCPECGWRLTRSFRRARGARGILPETAMGEDLVDDVGLRGLEEADRGPGPTHVQQRTPGQSTYLYITHVRHGSGAPSYLDLPSIPSLVSNPPAASPSRE